MENKRFLKQFASQADYEAQKDSVMGFPHVVLLTDTESLVYQPETGGGVNYSKEYFTIINTGDDVLTIEAIESGTSLSYNLSSVDTWNEVENDEIQVQPQEKVSFKCNAEPNTDGRICQFICEGNTTCSVQGNIMSLLFGDDFENKTDLTGYDYAFYELFKCCTTLTDANNLILPATTLVSNCYSYMFRDCNSLTTAPALPATTLAYYCYSNMFNGCSSLTSAPALPATTLATNCYGGMFSYCTGLTVAPELPATTLASYCYSGMFWNCTSLINAPELPATTLASGCYSSMFVACNSLTTAPKLPATTLAYGCYYGMFNGCSNLNHITMLATDISASSCLTTWVDGVSPNGVFVKSPSMTSLPSGVSGIPTGWTVEDYVE